MLPRRRLAALLLAAAALLPLAGCIAYRKGLVSVQPAAERAADAAARSVAVLVTVERNVNGGRGDLPDYLVESWKQSVLEGYRASGLFSEVRRGLGNADLQARVAIADRTRASRGVTYLSGMTFFLIPSRAFDDFTMTTTLTDAERKPLGTFEKKERVTTWFQIFLAPLSLVVSREIVVDRVLRDLAQATAEEAKSKGVL